MLRSSAIKTDAPTCCCASGYIELNPVRAGMVDDHADYRWSSYRANALGRKRGRRVSRGLAVV
jgi:putative transposase